MEIDKAIADYTESIRLSPGEAIVYNNRGLAWGDKQEYDKAIADYTEAIRLDPEDETAYCGRGKAWVEKKEYDKAVADYTEAIQLDPGDPRTMLWMAAVRLITARPEVVGDAKDVIATNAWESELSIYAAIVGALGARRTSRDEAAKALLDEADAKAGRSLWPCPVVAYLRGEIDDKALLALATDNDKMAEARCYLAYDQLLKGKIAEARENFRWVKDHGTAGFMEYALSLAELDRMDRAKDAKP